MDNLTVKVSDTLLVKMATAQRTDETQPRAQPVTLPPLTLGVSVNESVGTKESIG